MNVETCSVLIRELQNILEKQLNNAMRKQDITVSQARVLAILLEQPNREITLKSLEKELQLAQSVTAGIIKRLEQKKYIESFGDPNDKRIKLVRITALGEEQCRISQKIMMQAENRLVSELTDAEYEYFKSLLKRAKHTIEKFS